MQTPDPAPSERPLVVASNRLPFTFDRTPDGLERKPSPGGLVSALDPVLRSRGGSWIGWPGIAMSGDETLESPEDAYRVVPVPIDDEEVERYYLGFSNRALWPLLHSMPVRAVFEEADWHVYARVNDRFGGRIAEEAREECLVWIHDYHLMLAPERVRRDRVDALIAFFLHIPFPPHDVLRILPWDRELMRGLLACDLIGFHIPAYARNFLDCAERCLGARVNPDERIVEYGGHATQVAALPIGIDFDGFESMAKEAPPADFDADERIVLGVDRLDYTKGIPERILAFEQLLERHPRHCGSVALVQIAVPSRSRVAEYRELKREIDELVGRVNGRFGRADWVPIRYLHRSYAQDELAGIYRDADVALITPLRDGMNLVAKEFVACQVDEPGVLVLSRMTGAAAMMREALLVNPYDVRGTAETLHRALTMDEGERGSRINALRRRERRDNVDAWVASLLVAAEGAHPTMQPISDGELASWLGDFLRDRHLALFLDYDGTLTPIVDHPSEATLPAPTRAALERCVARDDTDVAIVSGRALEEVLSFVGVEGVVYAGNHGFDIAGADVERFVHDDLPHFEGRTRALAESLEAVSVDGAWTEPKGATLTWHYRAVPEGMREALVDQARQIVLDAGFQARDAHFAIEARPPLGWNKGQAVLHILRERYGPTWSEDVRVIYVGDDETDEDAFQLLTGLAQSFRVGSPDTPTMAERRLPDVKAVAALLDWLARR